MKEVILTNKAPMPIGPYSQAIKSGNLLFVSGQVPIDPDTGKMPDNGIEEQAKQVMKNLAEVLRAAGMDFSNVVKTSIFLKDLGDFKVVNEIYGRYFPDNPPARETVQVAALPLGAAVEISLIAAN